MLFKNQKLFTVPIFLVLIILGGIFGVDPAQAARKPTPTPTLTLSPTSIPTYAMTPTPTGSPIPSVPPNIFPVFEPYVNFPVGAGKAVGIGDFNSDGLSDVALTTSTELAIFLQKQDGGLANAAAYAAGSRPETLAVGDLNNDGRTDIVVANYDSNTISVFLQQADGSFAARVTYPTSSGPDAVAVGDINNDGLADIAVSHWKAANIGVFLQSIDGTINPMITYPSPQAGYDDIVIADINHDGKNDVIKMNGQGLNPNLSVYLQDENGSLAASLSYSVTNCGSFCLGHGIGAGDVTGDGLADIVVSYGGNLSTSKIAVFAQSPTGSLQSPIAYNAYDLPKPVEVADINQDGRNDVLVANDVWSALSVFTQKTDGMLSGYSLYSIPYSPYQPQGLAIGDLNQDGLPDVAVADSNNGLVLLYQARVPRNTPTPVFTPTQTPTPVMRTISGSTGVGSALLYYDPPETYLTSSNSGSYAFTVPSGWSGTIRPSLEGYRFTPESRTYSNLQANQQNQNFVAEQVYAISGNAGVANATLSYFDGTNRSVTSDSSGNYTLFVSKNWSGTITPSKLGVTFNPVSKTYSHIRASQSAQDYVATIVVTTTNDHGTGSLRQAIMDATSGATIKFDPLLSGQTIPLGSEIEINKSLTIDGSRLEPRLEISGGGAVKIFVIGEGYGIHNLNIVLRSLVLKNAKGSGTSYDNTGAAILMYDSSNTLTVEDLTFLANSAVGAGAAINSGGNVTVLNSEFISNSSQSSGGAISISATGRLTVKDSSFMNNTATSAGGAIDVISSWSLTVENTTFNNNTARYGGGAIVILNPSVTGIAVAVSIRNSSFSRNTASDLGGSSSGGAIRIVIGTEDAPAMLFENNTFFANHSTGVGGAIYTESSIVLRNNTFSENAADRTGNSGASLYLSPHFINARIYNNIFANNTGGGECGKFSTSNLVVTGSGNLVEDGSTVCMPTIIDDPLLGPLADNGGLTQTMALLPGSPAIDAGDNLNCPLTDQRGVARPQGMYCDLGAFEYTGPSIPPLTITPTYVPTQTSMP